MATTDRTHPQGTATDAKVDYVVDETGAPVDAPDNSGLKATGKVERSIAGAGPGFGWRMGLIVLGLVALVLLIAQIIGGTPGTDVQPGTPVAAPEETVPQVE